MKYGEEKVFSAPFLLQTHIDPVPEFIVKQILRALNETDDNFLQKK